MGLKALGNSLFFDKSTSGYIDLGGMRIQRGESSGGVSGSHTITLPAPFKDTGYSVSPTVMTGGLATTQWDVQLCGRTTTSFTVMKTFQQSGSTTIATASENFTWIAIGPKP